MTRYETLKTKPKRLLSLTGYTLEEFSALLPYFSKRFLASVETKTLEGKPRKKRRYTHYKNSCLPNFEDKLLFILMYLRKAMTQDVLAELFGTTCCQQVDSPAFAHRWRGFCPPSVGNTLSKTFNVQKTRLSRISPTFTHTLFSSVGVNIIPIAPFRLTYTTDGV